MIKMDLHDDNSEQVHYVHPLLPMYASRTRLVDYLNGAAPSHWHDDVEFIAILWGEMNYNVNGEVHVLKAGQGIFVNSRQLHFGYSNQKRDCEFICILLHPILLCNNAYMERQLITPVITNMRMPYKLLFQEEYQGKEIIDLVQQIYEVYKIQKDSYPLAVMEAFYHIWKLLYEGAPKIEENKNNTHHQLSSLKDMIGFIQTHYSKKMSLLDIAAAGGVCKSSCSKIFMDYLHQTPIHYLTEYRIDKSMELLRETQMNIAEVSYAAGFSGASYFSETFRQKLGLTPSEYRTSLQKTQQNR